MGRPRKDNPMTAAERMRLYRLRKSGRAESNVTETSVTKTPVTNTRLAGMTVRDLYRQAGDQLGFSVRRVDHDWGSPMEVLGFNAERGEFLTSDGWVICKADQPLFAMASFQDVGGFA